MNRILVFILMCLHFFSYSQTSEKYNSDYENYYRGEELFQKVEKVCNKKKERNAL